MSIENNSITLEEVARLAGVSTSTVSRYLSGTHVVSEEKVAAIEGSIKRLNYRPNLVARGLATGRTMTVGVLTQEVSNSFFNEAVRGVEDVLASHNYEAIFVSGHWNKVEEERRLMSLVGRRVDGVILLLADLDDTLMDRHAQGVPMVFLGRQSASTRVHSLGFDHYTGACEAVRHLIELGHRKIAFIAGAQDRLDAVERWRGYHDTLVAAGLPFDERLVANGGYVETGGVTAMNTLLDRGLPFTAVFAANDDSAYGAMLAMYRRGMSVPDDMSIVGYDDLPHSSFSLPPLTSVRQPLRDLGREAASAVVALIEGHKPPRATVAKLELIVRESTKAVPLGG
ncbi:MAG: LacI family DNA-binding transcriptional regulator [Burkholderiales bacterium]|nr:LacI family DNA-binding transcriptional regulator [Burkholderiales bacterium]